VRRLATIEKQMLASPDQQISLTDPDSRSMATSGRGSVVGYNVQVAVDTENHLIVTHEVTNVGSDRPQLATVAKNAKAALQTKEKLEAVAHRGYFNGEEILACEEAGITVTLPKPMTSNSKAEGRFGKQDFRYVAEEDVYICPAGERLSYHYTNEENGLVLRRLSLSHYNEVPTHLSLEKDTPVSRAVERTGHILCRPVLGGLHHQYIRI
jgi:hypothetical protein